jgi:DnaK suppressor protein
MALTAEQREELGKLLERDRARLVRRLRRYGEALDAAADTGFSQHMAEEAAALTERETAALMASEEGRRLVEVNRALERLARDPESFGICASCGAEIAYERLEAMPATDLCIECKRAEESGDLGRG